MKSLTTLEIIGALFILGAVFYFFISYIDNTAGINARREIDCMIKDDLLVATNKYKKQQKSRAFSPKQTK